MPVCPSTSVLVENISPPWKSCSTAHGILGLFICPGLPSDQGLCQDGSLEFEFLDVLPPFLPRLLLLLGTWMLDLGTTNHNLGMVLVFPSSQGWDTWDLGCLPWNRAPCLRKGSLEMQTCSSGHRG